MGLRKLGMVAALGASLASAPVVAQTQAAPLSVAASSTAATALQDEDGALAGGTTTYVIAFFVVVVIALGVYFAFIDDDGEDSISA